MAQQAGTLGTLSVLFTDLVGSTEQRVALGDEAANDLHRLHDRLVAEVVTAAGGTVIKNLGDGTMATFGAAADAASAAIAVQQAVDRHNREAPSSHRVAVRIGVSTGDVTLADGDVFGTPVVEASRLCTAATGGEILAAELVRLLARGRAGLSFQPIGDVALKGLPEPIAACRIEWAPLIDDSARVVPLPGPLSGAAATGYVGREALLEELLVSWEQASNGAATTVLLAGEPGIGKTRSASELARRAFGDGAIVLFGRCEEDLGAPYQPFVEALEWYVAHAGPELRLGRLPGELGRLLPELPSLVPGIEGPVASDPRSEEYRLFQAVASWLVDASADSGLVLVLDDLHWAARPTLQILVHLLRTATTESAQPRLLIVATYRDTDVDRSHPLSGVLADLRRMPGVRRIAVDPLTAEEVVAFAERAAGHDLDDPMRSLAAAVHAETDGNPFFVGEVLRHLVETGAVRRVDDRWSVTADLAVDVPEGVRDVVGRRVSRLSEDANVVLSVAAAVGRDVALDVVVAVTDLDDDAVVDAVDEGVRARLLEEVGADRYQFSHALVRTTLYEELSATRRRRLHRRIADAIEKLHPDDVVALAHHTLHCGPSGGDASRAAAYSIAAGEQALAQRAMADAERRFRQALELLDEADPPDEEQEIAARCGLGEALRDQGLPEFREVLLAASGQALGAGNTGLLVRAVRSNTRGYTSIIGGVDRERVAMIEAALDAVGPAASPDRALLLAELASEVIFAGDTARRQGLSREAEAIARSLDDDAVLAHVLAGTGLAATDHDDWDAYQRRCDEAVELADRLGDPGLQTIARHAAAGAALAAGEVARSRQITEEMVRLAADASPALLWLAEAAMLRYTVASADLATSSAANDRCLAAGEALGEPDRVNWWAATAAAITAATRGDIATLVDLTREVAEQFEGSPIWWAGHAWALATLGRHDEAAAIIRERGLDPEVHLRDEIYPFFGGWTTALLAYELDSEELAARCHQVLAPHHRRWMHYHLATQGPVTAVLGLCASVLGKHDEAVAWMSEALASVRAEGFTTLADQYDFLFAQLLVRRGDPGDVAAAAGVLTGLVERTKRTGASVLGERAADLLAGLPPA